MYILTVFTQEVSRLATIRTIPTVFSRAQSQFFIGSLLLLWSPFARQEHRLSESEATRTCFSMHQDSMLDLVTNLWGKSQCEVADESVSSEDSRTPVLWTSNEAEVLRCGLRWSSSQLHNHAVSAHLRASTESQTSVFPEFPGFLDFSSSEKFKTSPLVPAHPS